LPYNKIKGVTQLGRVLSQVTIATSAVLYIASIFW